MFAFDRFEVLLNTLDDKCIMPSTVTTKGTEKGKYD